MQVRTHYLKLFHRMNYIFRESILLIYRLIKNKSINPLGLLDVYKRQMKKLIIAEKEFNSRLFLGTGKFNSNTVMEEAILASGCEMAVSYTHLDVYKRQIS